MKFQVHFFLLIILFFFNSCCEDFCNYNYRDVTVLNNTAKVIEVQLPQKFGPTTETLRPFVGRKYVELIANDEIVVRIKGDYVESFLIDPCTPLLTFTYEE